MRRRAARGWWAQGPGPFLAPQGRPGQRRPRFIYRLPTRRIQKPNGPRRTLKFPQQAERGTKSRD